MKVVFAPWRMDFIAGRRERGCVFCKRAGRKSDRKDLILHRGQKSFVILNKYPYNNGHLMIVPYRHVATLDRLRHEEMTEIFSLVSKTIQLMKKAFRAEGFNVGLNLGKAAGAGIADHIHFHVIPRWTADTNFWPVLSSTKSMPEHLHKTYDRLKKHWGVS